MDTENNSSHSASELRDWAKSNTEFMLAWGLQTLRFSAVWRSDTLQKWCGENTGPNAS